MPTEPFHPSQSSLCSSPQSFGESGGSFAKSSSIKNSREDKGAGSTLAMPDEFATLDKSTDALPRIDRILALGTAALLVAAPAFAHDILEQVHGEMKRLKRTIEGDIGSIKEELREEVAYLLGYARSLAAWHNFNRRYLVSPPAFETSVAISHCFKRTRRKLKNSSLVRPRFG